MWTAYQVADPIGLLAYLETERVYAAYAIGDLEPEQAALCTWAGAAHTDGALQALVLHYRGLATPALFLMGDPGGLRAILETVLRPEVVYMTCRAEHLATTQAFYAWEQVRPMYRMGLDGRQFRAGAAGPPPPLRLGVEHASQLAELYALWDAVAFSPAQLVRGVFYGIVEDDRLVATAGTHLVSPGYGVAAVGNVFTHPDYRGRGYASAAVGAVVGELAARGLRDIVLNVAQDNDAAIGVYRRLGFVIDGPFLEGVAQRRDL